MAVAAGRYDRRIRIERPIADDALDGAGSGAWQLVIEVAASVQDALPSRGERLAEGINVASRPARVRFRYRSDVSITPDMRIVIGRNLRDEEGNLVWHTDRVTQIVAGPAEIGRRSELEFVVEEYRPAGNPA